MFHGAPYGIRAGPTMEERDSANASLLWSLATDSSFIYFISYLFGPYKYLTFTSTAKKMPPTKSFWLEEGKE